MGGIHLGGNTYNFNFNFGGNQNVFNTRVDASQLLGLQSLFQSADAFGWDRPQYNAQHCLPPRCCLPQPNIDLSGPPAGQGLTENDDGSVTTAGGYRIEAQGSRSSWKIFAPNGDELTNVWGDPHVYESDGDKWDFSKDSQFVLPDGTRILADTDFEQGRDRSVTNNLQIYNGADRAEIRGVHTGNPTTTMHNDGYQHLMDTISDREMDEFWMAGSGKDDIKWIRNRNDKFDGEVTGRKMVTEDGRRIYDQTINADVDFDPTTGVGIDPSLRPPVGSRAWGNQLRTHLAAMQAEWLQGVSNPTVRDGLSDTIGNYWQNDHMRGELGADLRDLQLLSMFGGIFGHFGGWNQVESTLHDLLAIMRSDADWRRQQQGTQPSIWT